MSLFDNDEIPVYLASIIMKIVQSVIMANISMFK